MPDHFHPTVTVQFQPRLGLGANDGKYDLIGVLFPEAADGEFPLLTSPQRKRGWQFSLACAAGLWGSVRLEQRLDNLPRRRSADRQHRDRGGTRRRQASGVGDHGWASAASRTPSRVISGQKMARLSTHSFSKAASPPVRKIVGAKEQFAQEVTPAVLIAPTTA